MGPGEPGANSRRTSSKGVMTIRSSPKGSQSRVVLGVPVLPGGLHQGSASGGEADVHTAVVSREGLLMVTSVLG